MPSTDDTAGEPLVGLIRRFVVEFMNGRNIGACRDFMAADYTLRMGDLLIGGRDDQYLPAVRRQLDQFPGMGMTVHALITSGDRIAIQFSEHGASGGVGGRCAAWAGIALYRWDGERLTGCVAEEDYAARRRQLSTGSVDPIDPPMAAPWDAASLPTDVDAERTARTWLERGAAAGQVDDLVRRDDEHLGLASSLRFQVATTDVTELFSAGSTVAFHVRQTGYCLDGVQGKDVSGRSGVLHSAGIVSVVEGAVRTGRIIRDRAGLQRSLLLE